MRFWSIRFHSGSGGHDCSQIPEEGSNEDDLIQHFLDVVGLSFYSDKDMEAYASHYYQSGTEMGYYGFETEDFKGLLKHLDTSTHPSAVFMPHKLDKPFKGELTNKVSKWAETADNMIYINGAIDTWSATAVPPNDSNSLFFFNGG